MTSQATIDIIQEALSDIRARITSSAKEWSRDNHDITLIAVSKFQPEEKLVAALEAGQRVFGENRVQEAASKWPKLKETYSDIELHLIGSLQTNKVKQALELFDVIEIIDRPKLVDEIVKQLPKLERKPQFYIQVNVGEEEQKDGVLPEEFESLWQYCQKKGLPISGLMCIPPFDEAPAPYFALLNKLAANHGIKHLSMGMSSDFETAISLGATHVRVGTAIFGERG